MLDIDAGELPEPRAGEMSRAADATGTVAVLARIRLEQRDQLRQRVRRQRGLYDDHVVQCSHAHQWRKIAEQVIRRLAPNRSEDRVVVAKHADGVAVRRGLGQHVGADDRAGARPVLDDHRLPESGADLLADDAHDGVIGSARDKRYDDADRAFRIGLRVSGGRAKTGEQAGCGSSRNGLRESHTDLLRVSCGGNDELQFQAASEHIVLCRSNSVKWTLLIRRRNAHSVAVPACCGND